MWIECTEVEFSGNQENNGMNFACCRQAGMPKLPGNDNDSAAEYLPLMAPRDGLEPPT